MKKKLQAFNFIPFEFGSFFRGGGQSDASCYLFGQHGVATKGISQSVG